MRVFITIIAAAHLAAVYSFAAPEFEVENGDFEEYAGEEFAGWTEVDVTPYPFLEEYDTWEDYGAFYVVDLDEGDHYLYRDDVGAGFIEAGETYVLTAKVKTEGVEGPGGAGIRVSWGEHDSAATEPSRLLTGTREWTVVHVPFCATDYGAVRVSVGLFKAKGAAWFDDVRIYRLPGLLKNGDMERGGFAGGYGWLLSDWTTGAGNADWTPGAPLTGLRSLEATAYGGDNYKYQDFDVVTYDEVGLLRSFRDYRFSAYVRTEELSGGLGAYLEVVKPGTPETYQSEMLSGTTDWTELDVVFTPEYLPGATTYQVRLRADGAGTAYFDRGRLERLVVSDPGFDLGLYDPDLPPPISGTVPWVKDLEHPNNIVEVLEENGNKYLKVYFYGTRAEFDLPRAYQEVELMKGCDYRITWRGDAGLDAGAFVKVAAGDVELFKQYFSTAQTIPPSFKEFEAFFYVAPEDLESSDSYLAEVTLSVENDDRSARFDGVFIEKVSERQDVNPVTVIPQPQAVVDLGFDTKPITAQVMGSSWRIYGTYDGPAEPADEWGVIYERLSADMAGEFDVGPLTVHQLGPGWARPAIVVGDVDKGNAYFDAIVEDFGGVSEYVMSNAEGYEMFIARDLVVIAASAAPGAFYGTQTLLHYLKEVPTRYDPEDHVSGRVAYVPCGHIYDWPDMPVRGTMVRVFGHVDLGNTYENYEAKLVKLDLSFWKVYRDWIRFLASMKVNALLIRAEYPTLGTNPFKGEPYKSARPWNFPEEYGDPADPEIENREALRWLFDWCRENYIEPIPQFGPMGHAQDNCLLYVPYGMETRYVGGNPDLVGHEDESIPQPPEEIDITDGDWHAVNQYAEENNKREAWVIKKVDAEEFGSPGAFFKVEKWEDGQWVPATYLPWFGRGPADLSYEYMDLWFDADEQDRTYRPVADYWEAEGNGFAPVEAGRNLRFKARDYSGTIKVYYNQLWPYRFKYDSDHNPGKEYLNDYGYCPEDPGLQGFLEDTINDIFEYLGPVNYFNIFHDEVKRMHTCSMCYDAEPEEYDGKWVKPCGVLLADDILRYYGWIEDAADTYQGGLQPYVLIHGDSTLWNHIAISFGRKPLDEWPTNPEEQEQEWPHLQTRNRVRNFFGYKSENPPEDYPDDETDAGDIGLDSWRWKVGELDRLVIRPWDYSVNMMDTDDGEDVVPKWTMTTYAREVVEGIPVAEYGGYKPPYWGGEEGGYTYTPYPKYKLIGCGTGFPERFVNYGRGPHKDTEFYRGRGGVYVGLELLNAQGEVITKTTPEGVDTSKELVLKTGQCIEGSLWHLVPGYTDEWTIPNGWFEQEDWYYVQKDLGKLVKLPTGPFTRTSMARATWTARASASTSTAYRTTSRTKGR